MKIYENLNIDKKVMQILLGGLLGDGTLFRTRGNASYSYCHSPKQKKYFFWKASIVSKNFRIVAKLRNNGPNHKIYVLKTNCSPILTRLHSIYYIKSDKPKRRWQKIINRSALNLLTPLGLAIWYCDDGTYNVRDKSCKLSTHCFSYEENLILKNYFFKKWDIKTSIIKYHRKHLNRTQYFLAFNKEEAQKFLTLIKNFVPHSMRYKLGYLSNKNLKMLKKEHERYKLIRKKWYYENHKRALRRATRYRLRHRSLINKKRREYYQNNLEKSREIGRKTMRKRRLLKRERVNLINKNYYYRNRDRINKGRRESYQKN